MATQAWISMLSVSCIDRNETMSPPWHMLRIYQGKQRLISDLDNFDITRVDCQDSTDKACIFAAIEGWYGSLEAFSTYIKGPFRQDVLKPMQTPGS